MIGVEVILALLVVVCVVAAGRAWYPDSPLAPMWPIARPRVTHTLPRYNPAWIADQEHDLGWDHDPRDLTVIAACSRCQNADRQRYNTMPTATLEQLRTGFALLVSDTSPSQAALARVRLTIINETLETRSIVDLHTAYHMY